MEQLACVLADFLCPVSLVARGKVRNETERSRITLNGTNFA